MKWRILVNDRAIEIDSTQLEAVAPIARGVYSVLLDGRMFEVRVVPAPSGLDVSISSRHFVAEVRDPRNYSRRSKSALGAGRQNISAPMPGKVIRVLVAHGDHVEPGQGLIVVEAMKMQNEMKAARPGRVVEVRVKDGDTVASGDTLVVLE